MVIFHLKSRRYFLKEQLYALLMLQEIDGEILKEKKKQKKLPARIQEIEDVIKKIENKYQSKKDQSKELQLKIKRKEIDASSVEAKIQKRQDELYGGKISDIKELKQLQKVIESLKKDRDKVEEDLLIVMDQEDTIKRELSEIEKELVQAKKQLEERQKEVSQQEQKIKQCIEEKNKKRAEITDKITSGELMKRYNMLWNDKEGQVVAEIEGPTCSGCNLSLPSDIIYHLQKNHDLLITCPNCNRILIWKQR